MPTETGYNGWTNRATWLMGLWLDNDERTYTASRVVIAPKADTRDAGVALQRFVENDLTPDGLPGFVVDLYLLALADVNWSELVESMRSE